MILGGRSLLAWVRVLAGSCFALWGVFILYVTSGGDGDESEQGSAIAISAGFLVAAVLTGVPKSHRHEGLTAIVAVIVGVALVAVGWRFAVTSESGVPLDAKWWLHRVGGAVLVALGGAAFGRLPSAEGPGGA